MKTYCERFREYLLNTHFVVQTDHQALVHWKTVDSTGHKKLWRWFQKLSEFDFTVQHLPGISNQSDGPSRLPKSNDPLFSELPEYVTKPEKEILPAKSHDSKATQTVPDTEDVNLVEPMISSILANTVQSPKTVCSLPTIYENHEDDHHQPADLGVCMVEAEVTEKPTKPAVICTDDVIKKAQNNDTTIQTVKSWVTSGKKPSKHDMEMMSSDLKTYWHSFSRLKIADDILYRSWEREASESPNDLICTPTSLHSDILKWCHDDETAAHFGTEKTRQRILERFYWPHLELNVKLYVDSCKICILKSAKRKPKSPLVPFNAGAPGELMQLDILENLPPSRG